MSGVMLASFVSETRKWIVFAWAFEKGAFDIQRMHLIGAFNGPVMKNIDHACCETSCAIKGSFRGAF